MKLGVDCLCLEDLSLREIEEGFPAAKFTVQSAAWSVWPEVSPRDLTVNSPTLRKAWKAVRNIAFRRRIGYWSLWTIVRAAVRR